MCQDWSWWLSDVVLQALFSLKKDHLRQKHGNIKNSHCSQLLVFELSWHAFSVFRCLMSFLKRKAGYPVKEKLQRLVWASRQKPFRHFKNEFNESWFTQVKIEKGKGAVLRAVQARDPQVPFCAKGAVHWPLAVLVWSLSSVYAPWCVWVDAVWKSEEKLIVQRCHSVWWALHHFPSNRNDMHRFAVLFTALVLRFLRQALISKPSGTFDYHCLAAAG